MKKYKVEVVKSSYEKKNYNVEAVDHADATRKVTHLFEEDRTNKNMKYDYDRTTVTYEVQNEG